MIVCKKLISLLLVFLFTANVFAQEIEMIPFGPQAPGPAAGNGVQAPAPQAPGPVTTPAPQAPGTATQIPGMQTPGTVTAPGQQAPGTATQIPGMPGSVTPGATAPQTPGQQTQALQPVVPGGPRGEAIIEVPAPSAAPGAEMEKASDFEQYVAGKFPTTLSFDIKQFGYELFQRPPAQQTSAIPVGPDYVLGPGDELRINVWGGIEGIWNVTIDRDGKIALPKLGILGLAGLSYQEAKDLLFKEFSKHYTDFELNVSMGQLRSMRIYVVGKAKKPGAFNVSALATIMDALYESGGPNKVGSMRNIQLKRNGDTVATFDLYDFLLTGKKNGGQRLMPEDVIFIPEIGPMVGVAGNVKWPAIYELKGKTKLTDVIRMAGGLTAKAYLQRTQVQRVFNNKSQQILDLNLHQVKGKHDIVLADGDIVKIFAITPVVTNKVTLSGNVLRPGEYEWKPGMRVGDILKSTNELRPETLMDYARIDRLMPPDYHMEYRTFNPGRLLLQGDESENLALMPFDSIYIYNRWEVKDREKVRTAGAVNRPGEYDFRTKMTLSDLVKLSGGLKDYARQDEAELTRVTPTPNGPLTEKIMVSISEALQGGYGDIPLQQNDYLFVRTVPEWDLYKMVTLSGEVMYPGTYTITKGEKVSSLLTRAGGYTSHAYLRGAVMFRQSVKKTQQEQLNTLVDRLHRELLASGTTDVQTAVSAEESKIIAEENKAKAVFLQSLKKLEAKGRLTIDLDELSKFRNSQADFELEEGDTIAIPTNPGTIQVVGAVFNQTAALYEAGRDISYYIQICGGYSRSADKKNVYIMKVNGSALRPKGSLLAWDNTSNRWNSSGYMQLEPGDTIVVPDRLEKFPWLRTIKDITQILFQIGTAAGIAIAAGK